MAYGQIYESNFYNYFSKLVTVKIYKRDYASTVSNIRITQALINNNYIDDTTPVIGHSAKIVFVNEQSFDFYDDLLSGYEKEYYAEITWNSKIVFVGFLICDLVEQQFLNKALISLQFTNYLRRLENVYQSSLENASSEVSTLYDLISEAILETELDYTINSNCTITHDGTYTGSTFTFLNQVFVANDTFYKNLDEYDDAYTVLNKILKSFDMFLYWYDSKWVLERYSDITRTGDWVEDDGGAATSLKQEFNKQAGDFKYINTSQVLQYNSGAEKLIVKLNDLLFKSLVFNNFTADMTTTSYTHPLAGALTVKKWYVHEDCTFLEVGDNFYGISKYFKWNINTGVDYQYKGVYYAFWTQFNTDIPNVLNINYKMSTSKVRGSLPVYEKVIVRFNIRVNAGDNSNYYIYQDSNGDTQLSATYHEFEVEFNGPDIQDSNLFDVSKKIELDNIVSDLGNSTKGTYAAGFIISFLPSYFKFEDSGVDGYRNTNYIGDMAITLTPDVIDNQIEADINSGFIKTKEIDLDLFDIDNLNYKNGLECSQISGDVIRTSSWNTDDESASYSLVDLLIASKFKKLNRTTKKIVASILMDEYLKPFSILTDNNLLYDSSIIQFIVTQYTWDLVAGTYDIEAEEFPDTDIILN